MTCVQGVRRRLINELSATTMNALSGLLAVTRTNSVVYVSLLVNTHVDQTASFRRLLNTTFPAGLQPLAAHICTSDSAFADYRALQIVLTYLLNSNIIGRPMYRSRLLSSSGRLSVHPSVCPGQSWIVTKRLDGSSSFLAQTFLSPNAIMC